LQVDKVKQNSANGPVYRQCSCVGGYGDYGCNQEVTLINTELSNNTSNVSYGLFEMEDLRVELNQWKYFKIEVCICVRAGMPVAL